MHRPLRQDLQQCRREALRPTAAQTARASPESPRGGVLLRGHDCPRPPDGHEEAGRARRVPAHRQVQKAFRIFFTLRVLTPV